MDLSTLTITTRTYPTGETLTWVTDLSGLLLDKLGQITDISDLLDAGRVINQSCICISDTPDTWWDGEPGARHSGMVRTTYQGGIPQITLDDVLDLAEEIRTQLAS